MIAMYGLSSTRPVGQPASRYPRSAFGREEAEGPPEQASLAQRVLAHERVELGNQLRLQTERELSLDALLERRQPLLLERRPCLTRPATR